MNTCPKCGAIHRSPFMPRPNGYVPCEESQVCYAEGGLGCLRRQLAAVTAERDKARYGEAEAMAVIMSLEGMCERLTAERDEQRALAEAASSQLRAAVDGYEKAEAKLEKVRLWWREYRLGNASRPGLDAILAHGGGEGHE